MKMHHDFQNSTQPAPMPSARRIDRLPPLTPNASLRWDVAARLLPARPGAVLELGCGRGAAGARIARRAERYVGCEPDPESFAAASVNLEGLGTVYNCMSTDLPGSEQFDTVCAFEVLEHIEDDAAALAEWCKRLKPGGTLIVSVPAWRSRFGAADKMVGHFRRYDPQDLRERLEKAGLTDVRLELYGFPAGHLLEMFRNLAASRRLAKGAAPVDIAARTAGSGRLFQPGHGLSGIVAGMVSRPMVWLQRLFPNRGVGLVAQARLER